MSRGDAQCCRDILDACDVIAEHVRRGPAGDPLADGLVYDAVRVRLIEIGEAVEALDDDLTATEPQLPWREISGMRDRLAHRYFDTDHAVVAATIRHDLPVLRAAVERLVARANRASQRPAGQ